MIGLAAVPDVVLAADDTPLDALELVRLRGVTPLPVVEGGRIVAVVGHAELRRVVREAVSGSMRHAEAARFGDVRGRREQGCD